MTIRTDISVDFSVSPRIITVASPSTEIVMQDLLDTLRSIEAKPYAIDETPLVSGSGKEPLGGGVLVGLTVSLLNAKLAFEARPGPSYTQCSASGGNLVAFDDVGSTIPAIEPTAFTQVVLTSSSSATLQNQKQLEAGLFNGVIAIDVINGISGTGYSEDGTPIGTHEVPSDNMTDALAIAQNRGIEVFVVHGDLTLTSGDNVSGHVFRGENAIETNLIIETGADVSNCQFQDMIIQNSVLDGYAYLNHVSIGNVTGFSGYIENSVISYNLQLTGAENKFLVDCKSGCVGLSVEIPVIDINNAEHHIAIRNWSGPIKFINSNNALTTACVDVGSGATVVIDSTVTEGEFIIRGSAQIQHTQTGNENIVHQTMEEGVWTTVNGAKVRTETEDLHQFGGHDADNSVAISGDGVNQSVLTVNGKVTTITPTSITRTP